MGVDYVFWSLAFTRSRLEDLKEYLKKNYPNEKLAGVYFDLSQAIKCLDEASELYKHFLELREKGKED